MFKIGSQKNGLRYAMEKWVLVFRWEANETFESAGQIWIQDEEKACFDIKDAKVFISEAEANQFKKNMSGNFRLFEPEKLQ